MRIRNTECLRQKNLPSLVDSTSGLKGRVSSSSEGTWDEPARYTLFLESRLLIPDMTQVYKIIMEKDMVKSETRFLSVNSAGRNTRSTADPLNLRVQPARLEVRRHFFSNRVVEQNTFMVKKCKNSEKFQKWLRSSQSNNGGKHVKCSRQSQDRVCGPHLHEDTR
jgi:hypothetical protein